MQTLVKNSVCPECHFAHTPSSFYLKFSETKRYCLVFLVSKLIVQTIQGTFPREFLFPNPNFSSSLAVQFKAVLLEECSLGPDPISVAQVGFQLLRTAAPPINRELKYPRSVN